MENVLKLIDNLLSKMYYDEITLISASNELEEIKELLKNQYKTEYKFYCNNDSILENRCDEQCSWCKNKENK